jgi:hypothetical protein
LKGVEENPLMEEITPVSGIFGYDATILLQRNEH